MRRKLLGQTLSVKRGAPALVGRGVGHRVGIGQLLVLSAVITACGGAGAPPPPEDPYGPRVQDCIVAPRGLSDAAHNRMIALAAGPAIVDSSAPAGRARVDRELERTPRRLQAFKLDVGLVTQAQYAEFVAACGVIPPDAEALSFERWSDLRARHGIERDYSQIQPYLWSGRGPPAGRESQPVVLVTQDDAAFYCAWRGGRLPDALEWEHAARGPAGNAPEGFSDMGGNVLEWTRTPWPGEATSAVVKGNAGEGRAGVGRGAARQARPKDSRDINLGFRCAAD